MKLNEMARIKQQQRPSALDVLQNICESQQFYYYKANILNNSKPKLRLIASDTEANQVV